MNERRKSVVMTGQLVEQWLAQIGIPSGVEVIGAAYDPFKHQVHFLLTHERFEPVPEGEQPPQISGSYVIDFTAEDWAQAFGITPDGGG